MLAADGRPLVTFGDIPLAGVPFRQGRQVGRQIGRQVGRMWASALATQPQISANRAAGASPRPTDTDIVSIKWYVTLSGAKGLSVFRSTVVAVLFL